MWINPETLETSEEPLDGYETVLPTHPPLTARLEKAVPGTPEQIDGMWHETWVIQPLTDIEAAQVSTAEAANLEADITCRIQQLLDSSAKAAGYDSILTAIGYAGESAVPKFQNEGNTFRAWRSLVWAYTHEQLDAVKSNARTPPTVEGFLLELPVLTLPTQQTINI